MRDRDKRKALLIVCVLAVLLCACSACKKEEGPDTPENVTLTPGSDEEQGEQKGPEQEVGLQGSYSEAPALQGRS